MFIHNLPNEKRQLRSVLPAIGSAVLLTFGAMATPASAQSIKGSFGLSGSASLTRTDRPSPNVTRIRFETVDVDSTTGDFSGLTLNENRPKIRPLRLVRQGRRRYTTGPVDNFIRFGRVNIGGQTGRLTFDLEQATVRRIYDNPNSLITFTPGGFTGSFNFKGSTFGNGFFSASRAGGAETYQLTAQAVPEPLTILGTLAAVGILGVGKRELDKVQARASEESSR